MSLFDNSSISSKGIDKVMQEKEDKSKKVFDEILKQLKDLISSSHNVSEIKAKIDMLKEISPELGKEAEELLSKIENNMAKEGVMMSEEDKIKKMLEVVGALANNSMGIGQLGNDNASNFNKDKEYNPNKIDGSISVSV